MDQIPRFLHSYLWDTDINSLSMTKHFAYIIERILEYGDHNAVTWLNKNYSTEQITDILKKSKKISPKTGALMALLYNIPKDQLQCFQKPFTQKQNRF